MTPKFAASKKVTKPKKPRLPRASQACKGCRERKAKCDDGEDSCRECARRRIVCEDINSRTGVPYPRGEFDKYQQLMLGVDQQIAEQQETGTVTESIFADSTYQSNQQSLADPNEMPAPGPVLHVSPPIAQDATGTGRLPPHAAADASAQDLRGIGAHASPHELWGPELMGISRDSEGLETLRVRQSCRG